jgi:chromosome segregation ATPase
MSKEQMKVYFPVEETAREVDRLLKVVDRAEARAEDAEARITELEAELTRLREALERIANHTKQYGGSCTAEPIARAALSPKEEYDDEQPLKPAKFGPPVEEKPDA